MPGFKVSWSAVKAVAAVLGLAGATVAAIIGVAGAFAGKADTEDLEQVKEVVHDMDTRTQVMQAEQRMLIRYVAPDLPIGSDTP